MIETSAILCFSGKTGLSISLRTSGSLPAAYQKSLPCYPDVFFLMCRVDALSALAPFLSQKQSPFSI